METRIWNKSFIGVFIANALLALGQCMMNVLISLYADSLGATETLVGFAVSAFAYTSLGFKIVSAPAIDAFSRKKVLTASILVVAASYFLYAISDDMPLLIGARLLQGAGMAFTFTCCLAMAADALPQDKVSSGIGYFSLAQAACMAVGPTVGLEMADAFGYNAAFALAGVLMLLATVAASRVREEPHKTRPPRAWCSGRARYRVIG